MFGGKDGSRVHEQGSTVGLPSSKMLQGMASVRAFADRAGAGWCARGQGCRGRVQRACRGGPRPCTSHCSKGMCGWMRRVRQAMLMVDSLQG
jgi:hypothetical protein